MSGECGIDFISIKRACDKVILFFTKSKPGFSGIGYCLCGDLLDAGMGSLAAWMYYLDSFCYIDSSKGAVVTWF